MIIQFMSDLQLDKQSLHVECVGTDVLVLAGNISNNVADTRAFVMDVLDRHPVLHVVLVAGNRDFWGQHVHDAERNLWVAVGLLARCHFLEGGQAMVQGVQFVGGVLWWDKPRNGAQAAMVATIEESGVNPHVPTVVVTHFPPCRGSLAHWSYGDLRGVIRAHPNMYLWIHGHYHTSMDYLVGSTRVVSNPRADNADFQPGLCVCI